jgi:hypothetical protein
MDDHLWMAAAGDGREFSMVVEQILHNVVVDLEQA